MNSDNGVVSNKQVKTFDGMQKMFRPYIFYREALLMIKNLLDALFPDFKNKLPVSEYAKGQTKHEKENCSKNRIIMGYFGIILTSPKWMLKVKN